MQLAHYSKILCSLGISLHLLLTPAISVAQAPINTTIRPHFPINMNLPTATNPDKQIDPKLKQDQLLQVIAAQRAYQNNNPIEAASIMLNLARTTKNPLYAREALRFAIASKRIILAFSAVQTWLDLDPDDKDANRAEITLGDASMNIDDFAQQLREQVNTSANKDDTIQKLSRIVSVIPNKQKALDVLKFALQDVLTLSDAQQAISQANLAARHVDDAMIAAQAARAADPHASNAFLQYFKIALTADPDKALQEAQDFINTNPSTADDVKFFLARVMIQQKNIAKAQALLQSIITRQPNHIDAWYVLGILGYEFHNYPDAKRYLEQVLKIQNTQKNTLSATFYKASTQNKALAILADIAQQEGRFDDAIALYNQLRDRSNEFEFSSLMKIANIMSEQGKSTEALKMLNGVNANNDGEKNILIITKAQVYQSANQNDKAVALLTDRLSYDKFNDELYYFLATVYEDMQNYNDMEAALRKVMAISPYNARAYNLLGYSMADRSTRLNEAKELIVKANQLSPATPWYIDSLAWVDYRMQDYDNAVAQAYRAYHLSNEPIIAVHLGEILWAKGDQVTARQIWTNLKAVTPKHPLLLETLNRLGVTL